MVDRYIKDKKKFGLLYRYKYELDDCADKFFKDIKGLFFPEYEMTSKSCSQGVYHKLFLNKENCGYAIALNSADSIKKISHYFSDIDSIIFDEFQSETNNYCPNEVKKFRSIHTSIARGQNKQVRYVPVYMISNPVSIINPYYTSMKIASRLTKETKFLRGNGFVLEQGYNENSANLQKESQFNQAFEDDNYLAYSAEGVYLNDNLSFVEPPKGAMKYLATIRYNGKDYSIKSFAKDGIIYCDNKADLDFPFKISVTTEDHSVNYVMLKNSEFFIMTMKYYFEKGCFRFRDLNCKEAVLKLLSAGV